MGKLFLTRPKANLIFFVFSYLTLKIKEDCAVCAQNLRFFGTKLLPNIPNWQLSASFRRKIANNRKVSRKNFLLYIFNNCSY